MDRPLARPHLARAHYPLDWNVPARDGFVPFPHEGLQTPIAVLFAAAAQRHPDQVALTDGERRLTYAQAAARVDALAARIAELTPPGAVVGALLTESVDFPIALLACLAAGRLFLPFDRHYPQDWLARLIADARPAALIVQDAADAEALVPAGVVRISAGERGRTSPAAFRPVGPDAPAAIIFTSGSTGAPKAIVNSQRALLRRVEQQVNAGHITTDDVFMPLSSGCTIAGLRERLTALLSGATLVSADVQRLGARMLLERMARNEVTATYAVPALLRTLVGTGEPAPASLRLVRVGGDAVLWSDVDALRAWLPQGCAIQLGYSSSEAPVLQWVVPEAFPRDGAKVPIGYALDDGELSIVDEAGSPTAPGEVGELIVRSPYVALGHWCDGRLDQAPFPAVDPLRRALATGDLVRLRDDGLIDIIGRKDRQVKINGIRVEPAELEAAIRCAPAIGDTAVLPRRLGRQVMLIAYVAMKTDAPAGALADLRLRLKSALPGYLQPRAIHIVDAIPRLPSGKPDMRGLEALDAESQRRAAEAKPASIGAPPRGPTETKIAAHWRRLLGCDHVPRDADFFDLGGDSLLTLELMFALEQDFGRALPLTAIFDHPSVAALAEAVEGNEAGFSVLVRLKPGEGTPVVIVHGVGGTVMELLPLARALTRPVYALQARGLDGTGEPNRSIQAQARDYLKALDAEFNDLPLHLAGYSAGGLTALEMARAMKLQGRSPRSLTLIDTQTPESQWPRAVWLDFLVRRAAMHWRSGIGPGRLRALAGGLLRRLSRRLAEAVPLVQPDTLPPAVRAVYAANMEAIRAYLPARYNGALTLIAADNLHPDIADTVRIWPALAPKLRVLKSPGDHFSMLRGQNAAALAGALEAALRDA